RTGRKGPSEFRNFADLILPPISDKANCREASLTPNSRKQQSASQTRASSTALASQRYGTQKPSFQPKISRDNASAWQTRSFQMIPGYRSGRRAKDAALSLGRVLIK